MHPSRRRKKHPNYGIRTVEVLRGSNGFGFTISGQQPCILSCIVSNSPADLAGLRAGDFLISVNGISVSKIAHDAVVNLIGNCVGPIRMTIAENYYSDSSEEELDVNRLINSRKPKYMHKPRTHRFKQSQSQTQTQTQAQRPLDKCEKHLNDALSLHFNFSPPENPLQLDDEAGPIEYKALVGYLGTIEMPNQLQPNSRLQTVCSCIRKLRQEKRAPTAVLMTIFPTCLTLKNSSNHILAIYPTNRVVYIGSTTDRESRYFGLVTSAVCERSNEKRFDGWPQEEKKFNNAESEVEVSNSCHVFMIDPKIVEHSVHLKKAESFKITCTSDIITGNCLEFPRNSLYIVNLVQNMYKLQSENKSEELNLGPVVANSPQPSASSNSDSGIGFRDDCGNVSDRILVVEFPAHRSFPIVANSACSSSSNNRPVGIDASSIPLESLDNLQNIELNNIRCKNSLEIKLPNNLSKTETKQMNNLNNIRACGSVNIKNVLEKSENIFLTKQNNDSEDYNYRLTCRAMPDRPSARSLRELSPTSAVSSDDNNTRTADIDTGQVFSERAIDVAENVKKFEEDLEFQSSVDNVSMHSSTSDGVFKAPKNVASLFGGIGGGGGKRSKRGNGSKMVNSCDNFDKFDDTIMKYKLSPKVYGLAKPNHSCEELNNFDSIENKYGYGSLQELNMWGEREQPQRKFRNIAQSEPDVRIQRMRLESGGEENGFDQNENGAASWAQSFEKLLDDPMGLHTFAEFVKKEFSAENIYFWTACERYRKLPQGPERLSEAQRIFTQHLAIGAPEGVNVDAHARRCTEQGVADPSDTLFDLAQKQIFNLMKLDSYQRFLKSDLYKQCLNGEVERPQFDTRLMVHSASSPKLKKSVSNAEDVRRKSYLPWHRKNRSKSKDRGETEYNNQCRSDVISNNNNNNNNGSSKLVGGSEIHSSKSSLTSLDLALSLNQESMRGSQDEISSAGRNALCKIIFSNEITSVVQIKQPSESIEQMIRRLLEKRGFQYSVFEIYTNKHPKSLDISEPCLKLSGCEVTIEQRVVFKLDLPNKKVISVKSKATKIIADVLKPILFKYNYNLDYARVTIGGENDCCFVDINLPVTSIDEKRLNIQYCDNAKSLPVPGNPLIKVNDVKVVVANQQEITNQVFKVIQQEKAESVFRKPKSDKGSVKSEDWGSEHSSGIIGRFLRRGSGLHDAKKKFLTPHQLKKDEPAGPPTEQLIKKPVIAKLKAGVNKLHVACSESDELVEGLTRAQKSRLEDQRGTEINFELPDFLKDNNEKTTRDMNSRFYLGHNNYENRSVMPKESQSNNFIQTASKSCNSEESSSSSPPSPSKAESPKSDPPPLPPKPKNVPRKPPNWGQNGHFDKDLSANNKTLYLEKSTSSFV